jgi:putative MATE family efflux protein
MLQNAIGGLQGIIDHAMVGHYVGFAANAAIGVSWQIFLVVIVFVSSLFTGMSVLVARFAGAGDTDRVNRTVYQAFLTAVALSIGVLAPLGYVLAPSLLRVVNAAPEVRAEALPFLRILFVYSTGMLIFFMLGGALRSAGDARTPLRLGVAVTALNIVLNFVLIRGLGPIPAFGTAGSAMGTVIAMTAVGIFALVALSRGWWVVRFPAGGSLRPEWDVIRALFRFGLPAGVQGIAMNIAGVLLLAFIGSLPHSAEAQAAYAVAYGELFSLVTWTAVGLMGAAATVTGQNLGAGNPDRADRALRVAGRIAVAVAATLGLLFLLIPRALLSHLRDDRSGRRGSGRAAAAVPERVGAVHRGRIDVHGRPAGYRRHAQPALHFAGVAVPGSSGPVLDHPAHRHARVRRHLAGHSARPRHTVPAQRRAFPPGPLAEHRGGHRSEIVRVGARVFDSGVAPCHERTARARATGPRSGEIPGFCASAGPIRLAQPFQ